jgi:hypothetical protein
MRPHSSKSNFSIAIRVPAPDHPSEGRHLSYPFRSFFFFFAIPRLESNPATLTHCDPHSRRTTLGFIFSGEAEVLAGWRIVGWIPREDKSKVKRQKSQNAKIWSVREESSPHASMRVRAQGPFRPSSHCRPAPLHGNLSIPQDVTDPSRERQRFGET